MNNTGPVKTNLFISKSLRDCINIISTTCDKWKLAIGVSNNEIIELSMYIVTESGFLEDVRRYAETDPAAHESMDYVYKTNGCQAIMYYRIAHAVLQWNAIQSSDLRIELASYLHEESKRITGIDINPSAVIKSGFVIDHGAGVKIGVSDYEGVVIGETARIGENVTILNGVVLGAAVVNKGPVQNPRHPQVGNEVTICADAKILGGIKIGDNVLIGPGCRITQDIPSGYSVILSNQIQLIKNGSQGLVQVDAIAIDNTNLVVYGDQIEDCNISAVDDHYEVCPNVDVDIVNRYPYKILFSLTVSRLEASKFKIVHICVEKNGHKIFINAPVIRRYLNKLIG